ncbi:MAG: hypothetical protein ACOX4M_04165 [Acetivibrionales bacterium]|jgi:hypothetical protein
MLSSSDQGGTPVTDSQPANEPAAAQEPAVQPAATQEPAKVQTSHNQPSPPQATTGPAQPAEPPEAGSEPEKTAPLGVWKYIGLLVLSSIPVLGFIMVLTWSFGDSFNRNTRNLARALLILRITGLILFIVAVFTCWNEITSIIINWETS